jgi:hypothetical protein
LRSDTFQSAVDRAAPELDRTAADAQTAAGEGSLAARPAAPALGGWDMTLALSRSIAGLALIAGGAVWAIVRGLEFYGFGPVHIAYDLDQPPVLVVFVGAWILYRSRRR